MITGPLLTKEKAEIRSHLILTPEEKSLQNVVYNDITYAPHDLLDLNLNESLERFYHALEQKNGELRKGRLEIIAFPPSSSRDFEIHGGPSPMEQTTVIYYVQGNGKSQRKELIFEAGRDLSKNSSGPGTYEFIDGQVHGGFERDYGKVTISAKGILRRPELTAERIIAALNEDIAGRTRPYGI